MMPTGRVYAWGMLAGLGLDAEARADNNDDRGAAPICRTIDLPPSLRVVRVASVCGS